ncbi:MAG: DNA polymerase III subunit epsilon [Gammaproteobacteria bacterium GWE2_42_36]|nr:MAG: DNA polymerase III subunit epsilon [Gammaproteobacteria bacterium GWE2_42_36]
MADRQIVIDTETTGLRVQDGHRIIEIGCIELINRRLTGNHFHRYLNPERAVDQGALEVHGLTDEFLSDKPKFSDIAEAFFEFIQGAELIAHNAAFDLAFIRDEFKRSRFRKDVVDHCTVIDTLSLARQRHPGQKNNLDALRKRYGVDHINRKWHGALLDAEILAQVYLSMTGGQTVLFSETASESATQIKAEKHHSANAQVDAQRSPIVFTSEEENQTHSHFLDLLDKQQEMPCLWRQLESST